MTASPATSVTATRKRSRSGCARAGAAVDLSLLDFNEMSIAVQSLGTDFTEYATAIEEVDPEDVRDPNEYLDRIGVSNEEHRRALTVCAGELCENRKRSEMPSMRVEAVVDEKSQTSSLSIQPIIRAMERASLHDGGFQSCFLSSEFPSIEGQSTIKLASIDYGSLTADQLPARSDVEAAAKAQKQVERYPDGYEVRLPVTGQLLFTVDKYIASGSFGEVYRVTSAASGVKRAMKRVKYDRTGRDKTELLHCKEAKLMLELPQLHPNVVSLHYCVVAETEFLMFQDYVEMSKDLKEMIKTTKIYQGTFRAVRARILAVLIDIAEALRHLHEFGIMHQDVKSEKRFDRIQRDRASRRFWARETRRRERCQSQGAILRANTRIVAGGATIFCRDQRRQSP